jgi:adenosylcobinamide-phosphate synthase
VEGLTGLLGARPDALAVAVVLDLLLGDPVYRFHPVRLIGASLTIVENGLRRVGANGYGGGIALFVILASIWIFIVAFLQLGFTALGPWPGWLFHVFIVYSLLAMGDLVRAVWRVERALERQDLAAARFAISRLVGRDTDSMDEGACRRAAIESLSENLADGFISAIFWYVLLGLPGLVVFKVVSTMDSMVGYKTPRYLRFGWCGARLDDVLNFIPARLTWVLTAASALVVPGGSPVKALAIGYRQARVLPSPNSGWPEAATAGAIQRRLLGPIWKNGRLVTDIWLGDPNDPPVSTHADMKRATAVNVIAGMVAAVAAVATLVMVA